MSGQLELSLTKSIKSKETPFYMKIAVKARPETSELVTFRVPSSLKQTYDQLRMEAEDKGVDFTATMVDVLRQAAPELATELKGYKPEHQGRATKKSPGTRPKAAATNGSLEDLQPPENNPPLADGADEGETD
jgi:hypothetical protein